MLEFRYPVTVEHLKAIVEHHVIDGLKVFLEDEHLSNLANGAFSGVLLEGSKPVAAGGFVEYWPGRVEAWAMLSSNMGHRLLQTVRVMRYFLRNFATRRIEAVVQKDYTHGHRLMRLLDFECEAETLRCYQVDGKDCTLYAKVKQ